MYMIDTSIFSYLFRYNLIYKQYPDDMAPAAQIFLSVRTLGELLDGAWIRTCGSENFKSDIGGSGSSQ